MNANASDVDSFPIEPVAPVASVPIEPSLGLDEFISEQELPPNSFTAEPGTPAQVRGELHESKPARSAVPAIEGLKAIALLSGWFAGGGLLAIALLSGWFGWHAIHSPSAPVRQSGTIASSGTPSESGVVATAAAVSIEQPIVSTVAIPPNQADRIEPSPQPQAVPTPTATVAPVVPRVVEPSQQGAQAVSVRAIADPTQTTASGPRRTTEPPAMPTSTVGLGPVVEPPQAPAEDTISSQPTVDALRAAVANDGSSASPPAAAAPTMVPRTQESAIRDLLADFQAAYSRLDAPGAKALWPSVDERALQRAFGNLESQRLTLDACRIQLGTTSALAYCNGLITYVGKLGSREQSRRSNWTFSFKKAGDAWKVQTLEIR